MRNCGEWENTDGQTASTLGWESSSRLCFSRIDSVIKCRRITRTDIRPSSVNLGTQQLKNANKFVVGKLHGTWQRDGDDDDDDREFTDICVSLTGFLKGGESPF